MTKKDFILLSWKLLEAKVLYYLYPSSSTMPDSEYDELEKSYVNYCTENDVPNTVQSMVGIDKDRPSVQLAVDKILSRE